MAVLLSALSVVAALASSRASKAGPSSRVFFFVGF